MRFEIGAAYAMGVGLPLLEAMRRKTNFEHFHSYVDDFIAGALLLYAAQAVTRLIDMGIDPFMVASSVLLVAAQRLCRKLCERCRQEEEKVPSAEELLKIGFRKEEIEGVKIWRPVGCSSCANGYRGRFAILETLEMNDDVRRMVIDGKSAIDIKRFALRDMKMMTLRRSGLLNAMRGKTSLEEVLRITMGDEY